jgi:hypothetical protein
MKVCHVKVCTCINDLSDRDTKKVSLREEISVLKQRIKDNITKTHVKSKTSAQSEFNQAKETQKRMDSAIQKITATMQSISVVGKNQLGTYPNITSGSQE